MIDSEAHYFQRVKTYQEKLKAEDKRLSIISNLRLLVFVLGLGASIYLYFRQSPLAAGLVFGIGFLIFFCLIVIHNRVKLAREQTRLLLQINQDSIKRTTGDWKDFKDGGDEFIDHDHAFIEDLDIFGDASLYKWINTCHTYKGRRLLAKWLLDPSGDIDEIEKRQEAARELAGKIDYRQSFEMYALLEQDGFEDPEPLFSWVSQDHIFYRKPLLRIIVNTLPLLTIGSFVAAVTGLISYLPALILLVLQIGLISLKYIEMSKIIEKIEPNIKNIDKYKDMLKAFENESFSSKDLNRLKEEIRGQSQRLAHLQLAELDRVVRAVLWRRNQFYIIINILLLWDYRCVIGLESWKKKSGHLLRDWILTIARLEALNSIAILYCDHADWAIPSLEKDSMIGQEGIGLTASQLGHPLLSEDRVCNDFKIRGEGRVYLITGSNMSGKSTLLRTVGINLVLAYCGGPVCAKSFSAGCFKIYSSMRVRDNLEKNISSFYAELLRIKKIIEAAKAGERVFFLLDEIFKGTNSRDRHTGARILIRQLSRQGALGLVSTHDVELGDLADENSKIANYHFKEDYKEGQLFFDYKLVPGVSNTRNAIYLMKMAGVLVDEEEGL